MRHPRKVAALPQAIAKWLITFVEGPILPLMLEQVIRIQAGKMDQQLAALPVFPPPPECSFHFACAFCIGEPGLAIEPLPGIWRTGNSRFVDYFQRVLFARNAFPGRPEGE